MAAKCTNERENASKLRKREENSWIRVNGFGSNGSSFSKLVHSLEEREAGRKCTGFGLTVLLRLR